MKHFTKQRSSLCSLHGKIRIQMNNTVYTSNEKNCEFSYKKPSATKHSPQSNVYYIEFYRKFLFQYSLIGIVKPKFTRRNEIRCRILAHRSSVQKCAQKAGTYVLNQRCLVPSIDFGRKDENLKIIHTDEWSTDNRRSERLT